MKQETLKIIDIIVIVIALINLVANMFLLIPPSTFLIILSICAIYVWYVRKKIVA